MKKSIETKTAIFPMPVLMVATYNEDGSVNVMNAAWGMMIDINNVALNLSENHKTVKNIMDRKAFTISIADSKHVKEADYFGLTSANENNNKFEKSGLSFSISKNVDAPIINEFPICMECQFIEYQDDEYGCGVIGRVIDTLVDEEIIKDGKVDISLVNAIAYDPFNHGYYEISKKVGNAFKDGLEIKNK